MFCYLWWCYIGFDFLRPLSGVILVDLCVVGLCFIVWLFVCFVLVFVVLVWVLIGVVCLGILFEMFVCCNSTVSSFGVFICY